jgi:hypothetical protein
VRSRARTLPAPLLMQEESTVLPDSEEGEVLGKSFIALGLSSGRKRNGSILRHAPEMIVANVWMLGITDVSMHFTIEHFCQFRREGLTVVARRLLLTSSNGEFKYGKFSKKRHFVIR